MNKKEQLNYFTKLKQLLSDFSDCDIENGIMTYCLNYFSRTPEEFQITPEYAIASILSAQCFPVDWEMIVTFFEFMLEKDIKNENGIVFTPKYISDYIISQVLLGQTRDTFSLNIIDPGCGCGIFLISAAEYLHTHFNFDIDDILQHHIYGMDIEPANVRRCKLVLTLLSASLGGHSFPCELHISCCDSLKTDWNTEFHIESCDYIIGNPPYVNTHDLPAKTILFLKENFVTTQGGVFNIFYAFLERALTFLSPNGKLGFIVPNNFFTIKSAEKLREYLQSRYCLSEIVDFGSNMIFSPTRTYNCILFLDHGFHQSLKYSLINKTEDIKAALPPARSTSIKTDQLDKFGWKLVDAKTYQHIHQIEHQAVPIKDFIRTGIATLRDQLYFVDSDPQGYFKETTDYVFHLEPDLIKPIYKIPELKSQSFPVKPRHIIFPYEKKETGFALIEEEKLKSRYPLTYRYLLSVKPLLDERDKGKGNPCGWYAYGRSQGLNKYGKKLLFPTFASRPKFMYIDNEDALFCNGYAIFENEQYDLDILCRILNSSVMDYYIKNTSYPIDGAYYCYQKKYIEKFSLPCFSNEELHLIRNSSPAELDLFLGEKYKIPSDLLKTS